MTTFHDLLREGARRHGARPALLFEEERLSYAQLLLRAECVAGALASFGVGTTDHVALVMDNAIACVLAWLASSILGVTEIPINPQYRGDLLRYLLENAGATVVICDSAYLAQIAEIAPKLAALKTIFVHGDAQIAVPDHIALIPFAACLEETAEAAIAREAPERVILYTSGTTGPSKGVIHTQASCLTLARYNAEILEYDTSDRLLNFFPLYHQNARYTGVIPALCAGASIRLERKFASSTFWQTCDRDGTTAFNYLGSVLRLILNVTPKERVAGTHTIKKAFGAGAPQALWDVFEQRLGIGFVETYGLSEAPMATINPWRTSPAGTAGRAGALFEVAVVDEHDKLLAPGEIGEIVMRPKRPDAMMIGYHNNNAATLTAFRNLWFHSGDRGRLSAEGDLTFEERGKDSIRRRGENISAFEVESVLDRHPDIAESAVYALPCEETDEEVAAALVLRRADADLAAILRFAAAHLPGYAVPTLLRVVADLPRTPTAKVQKAELRAKGRAGCLTRADLEADAAPVANRPERARSE